MQCPICGEENKSSARFCAQCGAALKDEPRSLQPGHRVGADTYRIVRPLGKGGMGAVYLAANTKAFDRPCVVKEVLEYYDRHNPAARERAMRQFECEARTLASLKNPGIPDIYAYFTEDGRNYLVMEYIEGDDLSEGLHDTSGNGALAAPLPAAVLPVEDVVRHAAQICDVLVYLGQCRPPVMHNDIKPANIILDKNSRRAVLVDFGTVQSRFTRPASEQTDRQPPSGYGTMGYAAPELYEGKAEPRSDVYALAATVYHLLTRDDPRAHPCQYPYLDQIDEPLRGVLAAALEAEVDQRIDAEQFRARLQESLGLPQTSTQLAKQAAPQPQAVRQQPAQPAAARHLSARSRKRISVRVAPRTVEIKPAKIALGNVSDQGMVTDVRTLMVRNRGKDEAHCRLEGMPPWLTAVPESFDCAPGQTQPVSLRGRAIGLQAFEPRLSTTLQIVVEGDPHPYQVQVSMQPQARRQRRRRRVTKIVAAGVVSLTLAGLAVWLVWTMLPLL